MPVEYGCVLDTQSPAACSCGTGFSTTSAIGLPVRRSSMKIWPRLVSCTSAGVLPPLPSGTSYRAGWAATS